MMNLVHMGRYPNQDQEPVEPAWHSNVGMLNNRVQRTKQSIDSDRYRWRSKDPRCRSDEAESHQSLDRVLANAVVASTDASM